MNTSNNKKILSIITPYYKTLEYTKELASVLVPQLTDEVEWIIIDDGCHEKELDSFGVKVYHLEENSGNASHPRNVGLDNAMGEYIAFIDSDDMVSNNYIEIILNKIKSSDFDYCYISWEMPGSKQVIEDEPIWWNTCVWNCIYRKDLIGDKRFDLKCNMGEDVKFNKEVRKGKKDNIKEIIYFYKNIRPGSLSHNYHSGKMPYTRE